MLVEKESEKVDRMTQIFSYICRHSTIKWAEKFLLDLKHLREPADLFRYEKKSFGTNW